MKREKTQYLAGRAMCILYQVKQGEVRTSLLNLRAKDYSRDTEASRPFSTVLWLGES